VSHPMTLEAHKKIWKGITKTCYNAGFKSHNTDTCGLHIHVNRSYFGETREQRELLIAKMLYIFSKFWESDIVPFSRRNYENLNHWSKKPDINLSDNEDINTIQSKISDHYCKGRYNAINLENRPTVEFRIFRGTLKSKTIIASIQWLKLLIDNAREMSLEQVIKADYKKDLLKGIEQYEELQKYMNDRRL